MNETALQSKLRGKGETLSLPDEDVLPLRWSIPVWLFLSAVSWAAVIYVVSLIF